jgi:hypothetical protein
MKRFLVILACGLLTSTMAFADGGTKTGPRDTGIKAGLDTGVKGGQDTGVKGGQDTGVKGGQDTGALKANPDTGRVGTERASSARLNVARTARRPRG